MRKHVVILALLVGGGIGYLPGDLSAQQTRPVELIPYIPLHGSVPESPSELAAIFAGMQARSFRTLLERLDKAREDKTVPAVVLSIGEPELGWAQMQELRGAMERLKASGKEVHVFLESTKPMKYLLACAGSRVTMVPTGDSFLLGLYAEQTYFKGLLDKLGVQADMTHMGAYKAAAEPFTRSEPSPEAKEQTDRLVGDLFNQAVEMIAASRSLKKEQVLDFVNSGKVSAKAALEAGLVDAIDYRQAFLMAIQNKYGEETKIIRNYGVDKGPELDFSNPFAMIKSLGQLFASVSQSKKTSIAVVYVDGMIVDGPSEESIFGIRVMGSSTLSSAIDEARRDDSVKALVLRIDSPGGSALASDVIWNATRILAEKKPLIVSMGNVAASGGYYVACNAHTIFADPGTITGSIGVVGGKIVTEPMWNKIGLTFHETKFGKYADLMNTNRPFSEEERRIIMMWMGDVYETFKNRVVAGRKGQLKGAIDDLAGGRVYTGRQALDKGLVDRLGGLHDAIVFAAQRAGISDYEIRVLPEPRTFMELFMEGLGGEDREDVSVKTSSLRGFLTGGGVGEILTGLQRIDPVRAQAVVRALTMVHCLRHESVLTAMPGEIIIR